MVSMDYENPRIIKVIKKSAVLASLALRNRFSRQPVTGSAQAVVSLTSYGPRLKDVWYTIESIGRGQQRPARLILWVDDPHFRAEDQPALRRLLARGLEVKLSPNYGPHTKYYPYVQESRGQELPLVTADDDVVYPRRWLKHLVEQAQKFPGEFLGYRAHQFTLDPDGQLAPYTSWLSAPDGAPASPAVFLTGVGGVIYPLALQQKLVDTADEFMVGCPKADDIWINLLALRSGIKARKIPVFGMTYMSIPGSQRYALHARNISENQNDLQLARCLQEGDLALLRQVAPRLAEPGLPAAQASGKEAKNA